MDIYLQINVTRTIAHSVLKPDDESYLFLLGMAWEDKAIPLTDFFGV